MLVNKNYHLIPLPVLPPTYCYQIDRSPALAPPTIDHRLSPLDLTFYLTNIAYILIVNH